VANLGSQAAVAATGRHRERANERS
jgi:hypothetical protein